MGDYAVPGTNLVLKKNDMLTFNANHYQRSKALVSSGHLLPRSLDIRGKEQKEPARLPRIWPGSKSLPWHALCSSRVEGCNGDDCAAPRDAARHEDSSAAGARQGPWLCLDPGGALGKTSRREIFE